MANEANAALDIIRNQLQIILLRAELCETPVQCRSCAAAVSEIVKEVKALEAFVRAESVRVAETTKARGEMLPRGAK